METFYTVIHTAVVWHISSDNGAIVDGWLSDSCSQVSNKCRLFQLLKHLLSVNLFLKSVPFYSLLRLLGHYGFFRFKMSARIRLRLIREIKKKREKVYFGDKKTFFQQCVFGLFFSSPTLGFFFYFVSLINVFINLSNVFFLKCFFRPPSLDFFLPKTET